MYFIIGLSRCAYVEWYIGSESKHDMNGIRQHVLFGSENVKKPRKNHNNFHIQSQVFSH